MAQGGSTWAIQKAEGGRRACLAAAVHSGRPGCYQYGIYAQYGRGAVQRMPYALSYLTHCHLAILTRLAQSRPSHLTLTRALLTSPPLPSPPSLTPQLGGQGHG